LRLLYEAGKYSELPKGVWCLGKPGGWFGSNKERVRVRFEIIRNGVITRYKKNLPCKNRPIFRAGYEKRVKRWQQDMSLELGLMKNMIRIIDASTIEVRLSNGSIMKTDMAFLPFVQEVPIFGAWNGYAKCVVKGKIHPYHQYIAIQCGNLVPKGSVVDHIDRDRINNTLANLRIVTYQENMMNKGASTNMMGVIRSEKGYKVQVPGIGKTIHEFDEEVWGEPIAKQLALLLREKMSIEVGSMNGRGHTHLTWRQGKDIETKEDVKYEMERMDREISDVMMHLIFTITKEMADELMFVEEDFNAHMKYVEQQLTYMGDCRERLNNLKKKLLASGAT
jgi:hypothetical protein